MPMPAAGAATLSAPGLFSGNNQVSQPKQVFQLEKRCQVNNVRIMPLSVSDELLVRRDERSAFLLCKSHIDAIVVTLADMATDSRCSCEKVPDAEQLWAIDEN